MRIFLRISIFLLFLILFYFIFAPQNPHVKIIVTSNSLAKTENIYIAGNNKQLGSWQPDIIQLNKTDNNKWERTFTFETNSSLEFKFTKGSWASEALDENGNIPGNNNLIVTKDTTLNFNISLWNDGTARITFKGQITGTVNYIKQMTYDELLPRDIIVWLPPGYEQNPQKYYPVLYMNDGQNLFDPETSFTKVDWQIDEAADSLIRQNKIEPIIIVGIYNSSNRKEEYALTSQGLRYMEFIIKKLKPFIDSSYRTLADRKNTAVGGSSSGGLISLMLAWNYPNYFSKAACFSPAFKYENFDYADSLEKYSDDNKDLQIYIYNGGIGLEEILQPGVDKIINFMEQKNFKLNDNLFVDIDKSAEHSETAWAKGVPQMLKNIIREIISMKILVGSKNPVKINAVKETFALYFELIEVIGISVKSNVPDQPINDETYQGAKNRALDLQKINAVENYNADFFVGIEGGIQNTFNRWFAFGCMCIIDKNNNCSFGTSAHFELPEIVVNQLLERKELGHVMDEIMKQENTKQKGGAISYFTNGRMDRKELYIPGLISALVPFQHKQMYFK